MRDILFRGRRINNVTKEYEFVYGCYLKQASKINRKTREVEEWKHYIVNVYGDKLRVIPETVGQFTGLLDAKESKVFDGDIYKNYDNCLIGVFKISNGIGGYHLHCTEYEDGSICNNHEFALHDTTNF